MKKVTKIILISLLSALILAIVAATCLVTLIEKDKDFDISNSDATLKSTPDYGQNYINNLIFLGDFTSQNMVASGVLHNGMDSNQVWTGKDGTLSLDYNIDKATIILPETDEEILLTQALKLKKPRFLVITLGLENGVPYCDKEAFCEYYKKLIEAVKEISPNTKIIIQSILPVTAKFQRKNSEISNEKIDICNKWLCELSEQMNVRFLNTAESLKDSSGNLQKKYASEDGSSPNADGYKVMLEYIRTHGYKEYPVVNKPTEAPTEIPTEAPTELGT